MLVTTDHHICARDMRAALSGNASEAKPYDWDPLERAWVCQMHGMPGCWQHPECIANRPSDDTPPGPPAPATDDTRPFGADTCDVCAGQFSVGDHTDGRCMSRRLPDDARGES